MPRNNPATAIVSSMALGAIVSLAAMGQSPSTHVTASFPAVWTVTVWAYSQICTERSPISADRIVFEAFPEVENVTLPCSTIKEMKLSRWNNHVIKIVSATTTYRF